MLIVDPKNYLYFSTLSSDIPTNEICYGNIELARIFIILTDNVQAQCPTWRCVPSVMSSVSSGPWGRPAWWPGDLSYLIINVNDIYLHDDQGQVLLWQRDHGHVRPLHELLVHHLHGDVEALLCGDHPPLGRLRLWSRGGASPTWVPGAAQKRQGRF